MNKEGRVPYDAKYYCKNKETILKRCAKYQKENKEKIAKRKAKYYIENKERIRKWNAKYQKENKETLLKQRAKCSIEKKEKIRTSSAKYGKTPTGKMMHAKRDSKRKRHLGFVPLNEYFKGSNGHHINKNAVIYIPAEIHRSVSHNIFSGQGMQKINDLAFSFLAEQRSNGVVK